jgi:probable F420-dependent oxidoreductase
MALRYGMFLSGWAPDAQLRWARRIEEAGFDSLWSPEVSSSALIPLAALAPVLRRIKLGSGVVLAFNHSPVMLALSALDLDLLCGGRFILGLGAGDPRRNNDFYAGHDAGKPVSQMREYISVLRLVMERAASGGEVTFDGRFYRLKGRGLLARAARQPRARVPVYIAAVKPKMARLVGEAADGLVGNPMFSPRHVSEVVLPALRAGLEAAGRRRSDVEVLGQCFAVIEDDLATAYRVAAGAMLFSIRVRAYDDIFAAHGWGETIEKVRAAYRAGGAAKAVEEVPRELVDNFCAVGPADRVRARVAEREGLLDAVILGVPVTQTTPEEQDHYRKKLLEVFGS